MDLPNTLEALKRVEPRLIGANFTIASPMSSADEALEAIDELERVRIEVCDAFYLDCCIKGIPNSKDKCRLVGMKTLKEWAGWPN